MTDQSERDNILRFNVDTNINVSKKYAATAKYNRKALSRRLKLEEWIHDQLRDLYACQNEEDDYKVEIDVDRLMEENSMTVKTDMLQKLLGGAKLPIEDFIKELLEKVDQLESSTKETDTTTPTSTDLGDF